MRIAQIAPLYESIPPQRYGGTERVVSYLTEALVAAGHDVTLFASGDSVTSARLEAQCARSLRLDPRCRDPIAPHLLMAEKVCQSLDRFDIVHSHMDYLLYPLARRSRTPVVTTLHGRLDCRELAPIYGEFRELPLISISDAQRNPLPGANWVGTVHHGLPRRLYRFYPEPGNYLAFLGRMSLEKRPDRAVLIARGSGMPLRMAAKVDPVDEEYFRKQIAPLLSHPLVRYLGEIPDSEKNDFLGRARALLMPIDWPEPFGLVMIEAMACGTPVIAFRGGAVEEVLEPGVTGFICGSLAEAVAAVERCARLDRARIRSRFERRFSAERMTSDYLSIYAQALQTAAAEGGDGCRRSSKYRTSITSWPVPFIPMTESGS